jgi:hypothetical protein
MGLTLIRKSDGTRPVANPTVALVLAGGAISGGAFKVGGLKALNDFLVDRKITDLDLYVGLSAGAILGSSLAAGVSPDEMIRVLDGTSTRLDQLRPFDLYNPNLREFVTRPARFAYDLAAYLPSISIDFARGVPGCPRRSRGRCASSCAVPTTRVSKCSRCASSSTSRPSASCRRSPITSPAESSTTRASSAGCGTACNASRCPTTSAHSRARRASGST